MLNLLLVNPIAFVIAFGGLLLSITIHEAAHCLITDKLGDPTPRIRGRLTLDPRSHLDPLGIILILLTGFGWGKPAPYDPYNLRSPIRDTALIALAGPLSNILIAVILSIGMRFFGSAFDLVAQFLIYINLSLAIFNLIPVYPLDGGKIMRAILPRTASIEYEDMMERYGNIILLFLILPWGGTSAVSHLVGPVVGFLAQVLI